MRTPLFTLIRASALGTTIVIAAASCASSTTSTKSSAASTTTGPAPSTTTSTTLSPAAAKVAAQAFVRGTGAPLLTFVRQTAAFSGSTPPAGATLQRCRVWAAQADANHLTYDDLLRLARGLPTPELRSTFGKTLLLEWIVLSKCLRPSHPTVSQARAAASARADLLRSSPRADRVVTRR